MHGQSTSKQAADRGPQCGFRPTATLQVQARGIRGRPGKDIRDLRSGRCQRAADWPARSGVAVRRVRPREYGGRVDSSGACGRGGAN